MSIFFIYLNYCINFQNFIKIKFILYINTVKNCNALGLIKS